MTFGDTTPARAAAQPALDRARIGGLDLARAIAFIGMVAAHIGDDGAGGSGHGWEWLWVASGRSSALFAVLAGVSIGIIASRSPSAGHARVKVAVRAMLLVLVGVIVTALGTPVYVILPNLGLMMLMASLAITWRTSWLWSGAVTLLIGGGLVLPWIQSWASGAGLDAVPLLDRLWWHHYPALVWTGYLLVGLALSRLDLRAGATRLAMVVGGACAGVGVAVLGLGLGGMPPWPLDDGAFGWFTWWASMEPHSYSPVELVSNAGISVAVIGVCLWLSDAAGRGLSAVRALGAMAFTAYVAHLFVIAFVGPEMVYYPSNTALVVLLVTFTVAAWAWRLVFPQGPLETVMTRASNAAAGAYDSRRRA
ncbi:heparan-alpha-glucosaminide N-acetyltransferase domain-containing protein [Demequina zhanjiangensis]|uniref:Heparan-alpha-glucosaminide N-acetyltransferase domain-containing protein n=1 Tax=Demequina zhanjiangensis TaxID=3051659 RepID=A0ABT8G1N0_9MICO|nr:heparan-alpha-glucosaminide N-acetyltransferase domain-containing protein [Demequina sp. SYSU T00b26]MDN4473033.1 heparan-alpha-glucosaminide N-acetyltransferase domain-containing protein [Demequina sp. SYSU T00b26]